MTRPKLLLPGPIDIWEETLEALSRQVLPQYGDDFNPIWLETVSMVKEIFQTENDVIIMTAPGSGALDAAVASLFEPQDKVFAANNGPFADAAMAYVECRHYLRHDGGCGIRRQHHCHQREPCLGLLRWHQRRTCFANVYNGGRPRHEDGYRPICNK